MNEELCGLGAMALMLYSMAAVCLDKIHGLGMGLAIAGGIMTFLFTIKAIIQVIEK